MKLDGITRYLRGRWARLKNWLSLYSKLKRDNAAKTAEARALQRVLMDLQARNQTDWLPVNVERAAELVEARQMQGAGPWLVAEARQGLREGRPLDVVLQESDPLLSQGAFGDIELALQNVTWKREVNLSWLEFSRWGIQQIILISRLYYLKNPIVRRLVNVCASYVFARGVEVTTDDDAANEVLTDFFERNRRTLGSVALMETERKKDLDGNVFWVFFTDAEDTGKVNVRTIDAVEIMDIICDPGDTDAPQFYRRVWTERQFNAERGTTVMKSREAWYPALHYKPAQKPDAIGGKPVMWESPIYHRKCGHVAKWLFGCPRVYPMLDWAKESRKFLEACASVRQSLSQIALVLTTKGGQQALDASKQQLQTTIGPASSTYDYNPPAVFGAIFGSGSGTKLEAFKTQGSTFSPEDVRQYKLMCCMVADVPETFLGDVSTGNLATATSLDRPTETAMISKQEEWREDLQVLANVALEASDRAPSGKLREALNARNIAAGAVVIREAAYVLMPSGKRRYLKERKGTAAGTIKVKVNFPAIREGDMPEVVKSIVAAGTLENRGGLVTGIDEKAMVQALYRALDIEDGDALAELQYPKGEYDPDRTTEVLPPPVPKLQPAGGPVPTPAQAGNEEDPAAREMKEAQAQLRAIAKKLVAGLRLMEAEGNPA